MNFVTRCPRENTTSIESELSEFALNLHHMQYLITFVCIASSVCHVLFWFELESVDFPGLQLCDGIGWLPISTILQTQLFAEGYAGIHGFETKNKSDRFPAESCRNPAILLFNSARFLDNSCRTPATFEANSVTFPSKSCRIPFFVPLSLLDFPFWST